VDSRRGNRRQQGSRDHAGLQQAHRPSSRFRQSRRLTNETAPRGSGIVSSGTRRRRVTGSWVSDNDEPDGAAGAEKRPPAKASTATAPDTARAVARENRRRREAPIPLAEGSR